MKRIKLIITLSIIISNSLLLGQESTVNKPSLLIYNFNVTNMTAPEQEEETLIKDEIKKKNYQYYSFIIPQTIAKNLTYSEKYTLNRKLEFFSIQENFTSPDEKKEYYNNLKKKGNDNSANYLITGNCEVYTDRIKINITIFDVRGKNIDSFEIESFELGVLFKETTDIISNEIDRRVTDIITINKKKFKPSPFKFLATPLSILSIGVDRGYLYPTGDWADLYNPTFFMSPFIKFDINKYLILSFKYDFFYSNSIETDTSKESILDVKVASMGLNVILPLTDKFFLGIYGGGGTAKKTITTQLGAPFTKSFSQEESIDPYAEGTVFIKFRFSSFDIDAGGIYRRIFIKDNPLNMVGGYAGVGFHF